MNTHEAAVVAVSTPEFLEQVNEVMEYVVAGGIAAIVVAGLAVGVQSIRKSKTSL